MSFSTTAVALETRKKRTARLKRRANLEQREIKARLLDASKPDPVLGHRPDAAGIWNRSELAQLILSKEQVWGVKEDRRGNLVPATDAEGSPQRLNFGLEYEPTARQLLFDQLPTVMTRDRILDSRNLGHIINGNATSENVADFDEEYQEIAEQETNNANILARVLDLRNSSGKGIQVENIRRIINHFGGGTDTGSPEVQGKPSLLFLLNPHSCGTDLSLFSPPTTAAVLTYRIRNLATHLEAARHDNSNRRAMTQLVQQRAKILKYLKRTDVSRYDRILPRIGVEARAVEGEITVPGKPKIART